ncbi:hypothetical protein GA0074695_0514 [Micromonospora viridifaciens]|uniref:Big-1 domain-containing protein n=1 Tax=Micromonospora viridifaciens TaxID=1881 RepID=A0A1C4UI76_MICVI|nr:hypothetical protein [Micromonospora viridifaciens]SCE71393.1 hypothetical protein GA0074695_0514 [Micromonospora viridifaciens]
MSTMKRRRCTGLLALMLAGGLVGPLGGCSGGCAETVLEVSPVEVDDVTAPLTVDARLTRDGRPVAGVTVTLAVMVVGPNNAHSEAMFYATTDADGRASVTRPGGVARLSPTNHQVTAYSAYFQPMNKIDGAHLCWSSVSAPITCRTSAGSGPCPVRTPT